MADKYSETGVGLSTSFIPPHSDGHQPAQEPSQNTLDEEQLETAMKRLKEMHIQLRNLRTTIPRLLAPLTNQHHTPQASFEEFKKSIKTANQEIQEFERLMTSEESRKIFYQAKKSQADNPAGIKPWSVRENPDWLTRDS